MNILVTGTGFIGQHLVKTLVKLPVENHSIAYTKHRMLGYSDKFRRYSTLGTDEIWADLTLEEDVEQLFSIVKPDLIFHLAGKATVNSDEFEIMRSNVHSTHLLLKHCPEKCRFILASSVIVHGDVKYKIYDEDIPNRPTSIYGISKLAAEKLVYKYNNDGKVNGSIIRFGAVCGAGATHGVIKDLLKKLQSNSEALEVLGAAPGSTKPFLHVSDAVQALLTVGFKKEWIVANAAGFNEINCEEIAKVIMTAAQIFKPIKFLGEASNWKNDNRRLSIGSKILREYGWNPRYETSEQAIYQAVKDMLKT